MIKKFKLFDDPTSSFSKLKKTLAILKIAPKKLKLYLVASIFLGLIVPAFDYLFAGLLQHSLYVLEILDVPTKFLNDYFGKNFSMTILVLLGAGIIRAALSGLRQMLGALSLSVFVTDYRKKILEKFIVDNDFSSSVTASTFSDIIPQVGNSIYHFSLMLCSLVSLVVLLIASLSISANATLFIICIVVAFSFFMEYMSTRIQAVGKKIDLNLEEISAKFIEGIKNQFLIRIYGKTPKYIDETNELLDSYQDNYVTYSYYSLLGTALPIASATIVIVLTLYLSHISLITLPPNEFLILIYILMRAAQTLGELSNSLTIASLCFPMLDRLSVFDVDKTPCRETASLHNGMEKLHTINKIQLNNLSYNLKRDNRLIIDNLSLEMSKGDIVVIKGPSGAGKSTLISLICGLLQPTSGSISVNNERPDNSKKINIREKIGYVGVDPFFINSSIRNNLLYLATNPESISDEDIWSALQACNLSGFVSSLKEKLDYLVDDTVKFSAGQKQRFLLARALLRSPDILLLDEATSNLDIQNELEIFENIADHLKDKITILVTHRNTLDSLATKLIEL